MIPNPSGPYPGRQLFLGLTVDRRPCLAYLVTGRSPESRQRKAVQVENTVRIGPLGDTPYDPLRHYTAIKYDNSTGIAAVSNGIQTEAIYETYRLLFNVGAPFTPERIEKLPRDPFGLPQSPFSPSYMEKLLDGAGAEPDSLHTPRIAGLLIGNLDNPIFIMGIKTYNSPALVYTNILAPGMIMGISTYKGNMDNPEPTDPNEIRPNPVSARGIDPAKYVLGISAATYTGKVKSTPLDIAKHLYDISATTYKGKDIRVCSIGGIYSGSEWDIAIINKH